ncbi:uncharacterized protein MICPUCDRAFT_39553 [Micromonas pusilla CCMP1545]|uniref:Predicted protein n=5 Tax=Micromonas pusilla TaxID=38833 RepID=C1MRI4_MICPC|nr:uncharacterized protein MICPUCDRAFT_39553 [Micromonas pusilla CCMP1545]EEH57883.1 predicted protein [Micromonas pusilla CCMP1545]|eukprot:XP_003057932.1 predicted protein [Micromonas pusilla CCMP1545]
MAELSRVRGADTDDQLLELQRAFLASEEQRASVRVTRQGGAPPLEPGAQEAKAEEGDAADAEKASSSDAAAELRGGDIGGDAGGDAGGGAASDGPGYTLSNVVGEIVERPRRSTPAKPPSFPTPTPGADAALGRPAAMHRSKGPFAGRKSAFAMRREAQRAAAAISAAGGGGGGDAASNASPSPAVSSLSAATRRAPDAEGAGVEEETRRRLESMSVKEIEDARAELESRLSPSALAFLKNRRAGAAGAANAPRAPPATAPKSQAAPKSPPPADDAPTEAPVFSGVTAEALRSVTSAVNARAPDAIITAASTRYALDGTALSAEAHADASALANAAGSAVTRDPLRADGADAGYTLSEALDLSRSSVPAQRVAGLTLLARVLARAKRWGATTTRGDDGDFGASGSDGLGGFGGGRVSPTPLPKGVSWKDAWLHALVDLSVVTALRRALDDGHAAAAAAAAGAIAALLGGVTGGGSDLAATERPSRGASDDAANDWFDALACAPPHTGHIVTYRTQPLWRSGGWGATFTPLGWSAAVGAIASDANGNVVPDPADEADPDGAPPSEETRRSRAMAHAADTTAALLRMGILNRVRYLLEVGAHPAATAPCLAVVAACARHSAAACEAAFKCPRLLQTLTDIASAPLLSKGDHPPGSPAAASRALRVLASSSVVNARRLGANGAASTAVAAAASAMCVPGDGAGEGSTAKENDLSRGAKIANWIEAIRLWAATTARGGQVPSVDGLYPLLQFGMEKRRAREDGDRGVALATEIFSLFAASTPALVAARAAKDAAHKGWVAPEISKDGTFADAGGGDASAALHPSTVLETTSLPGGMSWSCALGAASVAEGWVIVTDGEETLQPGSSPAAWRAAGAAAHFLAAVLEASTSLGERSADVGDAAAAGMRVLGLSASSSSSDPDAVDPRGVCGERGLLTLCLDALDVVGASPDDDAGDAALARVSAVGVALHGAVRLLHATPGASSAPAARALLTRTVRALTLASAASANKRQVGDGVLRGGRSASVDAAETPSRLALLLALESQDAAHERELIAREKEKESKLLHGKKDERSEDTTNDDNYDDDTEGAVAAAEATAALVASLPPGAGAVAADAVRAGLLSRRALGPLLAAARRGIDAAVKYLDGETVSEDARFTASAARDIVLDAAHAADPGSLVPSVADARAATYGGFNLELTSEIERAASSASSASSGSGADAAVARGPMDGVGSLTPLPPLPAWLLAPCSPKSTVRGWGPEGVAACLALLLGLEVSGSSFARGLPADAKLTAMSGIFCMGEKIWRDPAVAAAAAALTDTYWGRLDDEKITACATPKLGRHSYDGDPRSEKTRRSVDGRKSVDRRSVDRRPSIDERRSVDLARDDALNENDDDDDDDERAAREMALSSHSETMCEKFATESFGDPLFARHVAFTLRADAPPRARCAAWLALREGVALHLLPPLPALAPHPEEGDQFLFLPPGGECDEEMLELYVQALESGALDRGFTQSPPPLPCALASHAITHAVCSSQGTTSSILTLRRILRRPNTERVLRSMMHTPLTQKRRPSVAIAAAFGTSGVHHGKGGLWGGETPFGPGAAYGKEAPSADVEARRSVLLRAASEDVELKRELRAALEAAVAYPDEEDEEA